MTVSAFRNRTIDTGIGEIPLVASDLFHRLGVAVLSARTDAVVALDRDSLISFWSPGAERIFGYSSDEVIGSALDIIIPGRLRQRHRQGYSDVMSIGRSGYGDGDVMSVPAVRKDGATISVEFTILLPRDDGGAIYGMAAIMRDVSARFEEIRLLKRTLADATKP
jgi:PAS domain S-box-containing protein